MLGLTGTRVIVVDDKEDEALPVMKAFARQGVPAAFFHAPHKSALPRKKDRLSGVRLAILDMDLVPGTPSYASKAAALANYLGNILSPDNGPYGVLAWTYHPELVETFEDYVFRSSELPNPIFIARIEKNQCFKNTKCNISLLSALIIDRLENSPLKMFEGWEERCFLAATSVTNSLSALVASSAPRIDEWRTDWRGQLLQLLYTMARADAEGHLSQDTCMNAVYNLLNPLHADRMENQMAELCELVSSSSTDVMGATGDVGIVRKAKLNTMLHLAVKDTTAFSMGNIYLFRKGQKKPEWAPNCKEVLQGNWVQGENQERRDENIKIISADSIPVVIEVSAACDHAQNKIQRAKLLRGILVPAQHYKKFNQKAEFIKKFGPFHFERPVAKEGQYYFYFSSRQTVSVELDEINKRRAAARLRNQAIGDLQFWLAHQEARPGIIMLQ